MAKKTKPRETTTFSAVVSMGGDVQAGNFTLTIVQAPEPEQPPDIEEPPVEPPVEPPTSGWSPPAYLRTDTSKVTVPNVPRPAYLAPYTDTNFGTQITRITGDPGSSIQGISGGRWGTACRHHYSSDQAWNADETMIYLDTNEGGTPGTLILDGSTYRPIATTQNKPSSADIRWHPVKPNVMLCASKDKLLEYDPLSGRQTVIKSFSGYSDLTFGPWEGSPSRNGEVVVLTSDDKQEAFVYDISAAKQYPAIRASNWGHMDSCRISRSGQVMVWAIQEDIVVVTNYEGEEIHTLPDNYVSHFDVAVDADGEDIVVGRVNSSSVGQGSSGLVSKYRLADGKRTGLQKAKGWSSHTSCRSNGQYCVADGTLEGSDYIYNGELIMCALDASAVYRLCHTHTKSSVEYTQQTQPSHSPSGSRVIFASPWGNANGAGCYVVDMRE
jgi:hypothetical protein